MEKEILDYIDCTYLIYGRDEQLVTAHPKMKQYLDSLSFDQQDFNNLGELLNSLRAVKQDDKAASYILREKAFVKPNDLFCGVVSNSEKSFLVQLQRKLNGSFAVFSDVSVEYQYIREAGDFPRSFIQSQKIEALGDMAGGIAHDLNNVLSIIKGYARMLEWDKEITGEMKDRIDHIVKAVDRGNELTKQILDFGSNRSNKKEVLKLGNLIERQKILLQPLLNEKFSLSFSLDESICVESSSDHIFQILMNLIVNARDSMERGGDIKVNLKPVNHAELPFVPNEYKYPDGYCCLSVSDNGCGISEEVHSRIFESHYTTTEADKKTGMGMVLVKSIIRELNAKANIISYPDQGTTVQIFIPMNGKVKQLEIDQSPESLTQKTVLVVEDNVDLLKILSEELSEKGMTVLTAEDGEEALNIEKQYCADIDFLISDLVLPRLSGVDLAVAFQTLRPSTKAIMISGYPANAFPKDIVIPRGMSIISKPINFEDLEQKMINSIPTIIHGEESLSNIAGMT